MKFKSANIPNEDSKEFDVNEFNRVLLYPDLVPYSATEVKILVEIRISELEYQIDQLDLKEGIDLLSEEEYHVLSLDFANRMKSDPLPSNGYNELLLNWVSFEKTRLIDKLIILKPETKKAKEIARETYSVANNLAIKNYTHLGDDILILRNVLRDNMFIDSSTKANEFSRIFSDKNVDSKLIWQGSQAELSYLIKSIMPWLVTKRNYLKRTANIFTKPDGSLFDSKNIGNPKSDIPAEREKVLRNALEKFISNVESVRRQHTN